MSERATAWAPLSAFAHPRLRGAVSRVVDAWSHAWFPRRRPALSGWTALASDRREDPAQGGWVRRGGAAAFSLTPRARSRMLGWVLDAPLDETGLTSTDRRLLDGLEQRLFDDLAARLDAALGVSADPRPMVSDPLEGGGAVAQIAEGADAPVLSLALAGPILLPALRQALPKPRPASGPIGDRRRAIAGLPVTLGVRLGEAEVSLSELRQLAAGDVLVLDRRLADGPLIVAGRSATPVARAALNPTPDGLQLSIQSFDPKVVA